MAVGYRSILELDPSREVLTVAREVVEKWVQQKAQRLGLERPELNLSASLIRSIGDDITVASVLESQETRSQQLFRLDERNNTGEWRVTVVALDDRSDDDRLQSIMVEVEPRHLNRDDAIFQASPPRFVRDLLSGYPLRSGATPLSGAPAIIEGKDVTAVMDAILDPRRAVSVVVGAGIDDVPMRPWQSVIDSLTRQAAGVSTAFVLDEEATAALNQRLPFGFQVHAGGVRSFAPNVSVNESSDQYRHRYLGPGSFVRHIYTTTDRRGQTRQSVAKSFAAVHAQRARRQFVEQELPQSLKSALENLRRAELRLQRDDAALVSSEPIQAWPHQNVADQELIQTGMKPWEVSLSNLLDSVVGSREISDDAITALGNQLAVLERKLDVAETQIDRAITEGMAYLTERDKLREELDNAYLEVRVESESAVELQVRVDHYARRLREARRYEDLAPPAEEDRWKSPEDFRELVESLQGGKGSAGEDVEPVSEHVVFTGDVDVAADIDDRDQTSRYVRAMWNFIQVLDSYAAARRDGFSGGVHAYLADDSVDGHKCSPSKHAPTESNSVQNRGIWRDQRLFPVPTTVDDSGTAHMFAHFKPTHDSSYAPRMHYLDDTDNTGKIYIGYIGRHLSNTKTATA